MDRSKVFPVAKRLNKTTTAKHIPEGDHLLKRAIRKKFNQMRKEGRLFLNKEPAVVDYLAKHPDILTTSRKRKNVQHEYTSNGMIDSTLHRMPILQRLIATTNTIPTPEIYELFFSTFNELMHYSYDHGFFYIPDEVYLLLGFPAVMPRLLVEPREMPISNSKSRGSMT
mmetsp:Transcript_5640/g.8870  ORF Transcript_5640/g.8870 Transcript_5640/m.8870 type:complete len:169 (+) Transcript_5640:54-560(+)